MITREMAAAAPKNDESPGPVEFKKDAFARKLCCGHKRSEASHSSTELTGEGIKTSAIQPFSARTKKALANMPTAGRTALLKKARARPEFGIRAIIPMSDDCNVLEMRRYRTTNTDKSECDARYPALDERMYSLKPGTCEAMTTRSMPIS